jgi:hypothetical protein
MDISGVGGALILIQDVKFFDAGRAMLEDYLDPSVYPARLDITEVQPLSDGLAAQQVSPETQILAFEHAGHFYVLPMSVVICYNVIQGTTKDGQSWMMTFCNACTAILAWFSTRWWTGKPCILTGAVATTACC